MIERIINNKYIQRWTGTIMIILTLPFLLLIENKSSDLFWYDREFKVIEKYEGFHVYKGRPVSDYYLKVNYVDDEKINWIESVSGSEYFSYDVGGTYIKRCIKDRNLYDTIGIIGFPILFLGVLILSIGLSEEI